MNIIHKFIKWLEEPSTRWKKIISIWEECPKVTKISITWENGITKSLIGDDAHRYSKHDFYAHNGSVYHKRMLRDTNWNWIDE